MDGLKSKQGNPSMFRPSLDQEPKLVGSSPIQTRSDLIFMERLGRDRIFYVRLQPVQQVWF